MCGVREVTTSAGTNGADSITIVARDATNGPATANGVQDFTVSVNGGPDVYFENTAALTAGCSPLRRVAGPPPSPVGCDTLPLGTFISVGRSLDSALDRVRLAEQLGYHSVYTTHLAGRDSLTLLAAYANVTESINVAVCALKSRW